MISVAYDGKWDFDFTDQGRKTTMRFLFIVAAFDFVWNVASFVLFLWVESMGIPGNSDVFLKVTPNNCSILPR